MNRIDTCRSFELGGEVNDAHRWSRNANAVTAEATLEFRNDARDCRRGTGRRGHKVETCGARATRVAMRNVKNALVIRVAMDGGHQRARDPPTVRDNLCCRGEAVRGAAGIRNNVMLRWVVPLLVHAHDDGQVFARRRGADDHLLRAGLAVRRSLLGVGEESSGFHNDVDAKVAPRECGRIFARQHLDSTTVDDELVLFRGNAAGVDAVGGVVLEEVGVHLRINEVVDRHHLNFRRALNDCLQALPPNAAEAVNAYAYGHRVSPFDFTATARSHSGSPIRSTTIGWQPARLTSLPSSAGCTETLRPGTLKLLSPISP